MLEPSSIVQKYFPNSTNLLVCGDVSVEQIVKEHPTPLYIYIRQIIEKKLRLLHETLPNGFDIYYSIKANPNQRLLQYFLSNGCGLEVASGGEIRKALAAGANTDRIIFAGPGKTEVELRMALAARIGEIHVESMVEIERLAAMSTQLGEIAPVSIRVNPTAEAQGGAMQMGGKASPFGIDEEHMESAIECICKADSLTFKGVHIYSGTQILNYQFILSQYRKGLEIGRQAAQAAGQPLKTLNFGGGFGIPYFSTEKPLDMVALQEGLDILFAEYASCAELDGTQFIIELGRFLIGESGVYVATVNDIKVSRGKKFIISDGGMHHHLAASGNLGQTIKRNFPIAILNKLDEEIVETVDVVGPLCTPLDTLGRSVALPQVAIGDLLGVFQSGAYARAASPLGFLSHRSPAEIWVDNTNCELIRRQGTYDDMLIDIVA